MKHDLLTVLESIILLLLFNSTNAASNHMTGTAYGFTSPGKINTCPPGWSFYATMDTCYKLMQAPDNTWEVKRRECQNITLPYPLVSDLATIPDSKTNDFMCRAIGVGNSSLVSHISRGFFFGLKKRRTDEKWIWAPTDEPAKYINWNLDYFNDIQHDFFFAFYSVPQCVWSKSRIDERYGAICQILNLNPCRQNKGGCPKASTSICKFVKPGVGTCSCIDGFTWRNDTSECLDNDECEEDKDRCGSGKDCVNKYGSYECVETHGFMYIMAMIVGVVLLILALLILSKLKMRRKEIDAASSKLSESSKTTGSSNKMDENFEMVVMDDGEKAQKDYFASAGRASIRPPGSEDANIEQLREKLREQGKSTVLR